MENRRLTFDEYQKELIGYFKYFNDSFNQENIVWWAYAGTLLGAVRNKKQIEWDDDIDMGMTNHEFYSKKEHISSIASVKGFILRSKADHIGLVCNKLVSTEIVEVEYEGKKYNTPFFIDIFLYVGVKEFSRARDKYWSINNKVLFIFGFFWKPLPSYYVKKGKVLKINKIIQCLIWFARFLIFPILILHFFESKRIRNCKYKEKFSLHCKESNLSDYFTGELVDWIFEEEKIKIQSNYDEILKNKFGENYIELPPKNLRIPSHIYNGNYKN